MTCKLKKRELPLKWNKQRIILKAVRSESGELWSYCLPQLWWCWLPDCQNCPWIFSEYKHSTHWWWHRFTSYADSSCWAKWSWPLFQTWNKNLQQWHSTAKEFTTKFRNGKVIYHWIRATLVEVLVRDFPCIRFAIYHDHCLFSIFLWHPVLMILGESCQQHHRIIDYWPSSKCCPF